MTSRVLLLDIFIFIQLATNLWLLKLNQTSDAFRLG